MTPAREQRIVVLGGSFNPPTVAHLHLMRPRRYREGKVKDGIHIYLDGGSVVATDTAGETGVMSPDWKDGCATELHVTKDGAEISIHSIASDIVFPRGYYKFPIEMGGGVDRKE